MPLTALMMFAPSEYRMTCSPCATVTVAPSPVVTWNVSVNEPVVALLIQYVCAYAGSWTVVFCPSVPVNL